MLRRWTLTVVQIGGGVAGRHGGVAQHEAVVREHPVAPEENRRKGVNIGVG